MPDVGLWRDLLDIDIRWDGEESIRRGKLRSRSQDCVGVWCCDYESKDQGGFASNMFPLLTRRVTMSVRPQVGVYRLRKAET